MIRSCYCNIRASIGRGVVSGGVEGVGLWKWWLRMGTEMNSISVDGWARKGMYCYGYTLHKQTLHNNTDRKSNILFPPQAPKFPRLRLWLYDPSSKPYTPPPPPSSPPPIPPSASNSHSPSAHHRLPRPPL